MVVWGATPIATRLALDDLQPFFIACARTVLAGLLAIPLLAAMRQGIPTRRRPRILLGVSAATGFVIFPIVYTEGQQRTSAAPRRHDPRCAPDLHRGVRRARRPPPPTTRLDRRQRRRARG